MHGGGYVLEGRDRRRWWTVGAVGLGLSLAYALVPQRYTALRELVIYNAVALAAGR
jgi:hypothetical protein